MARRPQQISPETAAPGAVAPAAFAPERPQRIDGVTPEAFGAASAAGLGVAGRGLQSAGGAMSDILIQEQALQNETNASRTATAVGGELNEMWASYSQQQGQDAVNGWEGFQTGVRDRTRAALEATANPAERRLLERQLTQHASAIERGGMQWRAQQQRVASVNASSAAAALQVNNAVIARDNPDQMYASIRAGELDLQNRGEVEGWDAGTLAMRQAEYRGNAIGAVVASISDTDPLRAQALFNTNRDRLDAASQVRIQQHLEGPVRNRQAADIVADVMRPAGGTVRDRIFRTENAAGDARRNPAPGSTAQGPGQVTDRLWNAHAEALGLQRTSDASPAPNRNDRATQERIFDAEMAAATRDIGRPLTDGEQYAVWFLGRGAAKAFINAPRDADARTVFRAVAPEDVTERAFTQNGSLLRNGMTVGQVLDATAARVAGPNTASRTDRATAMQQVIARTANDPQLQSDALARLQQQFHVQDSIHTQERAALTDRVQQTGQALEIGRAVEIPAAEIRRTFEPVQAERILDTLYTQQISGQMYTAAQFAAPEQIAAMQADITNGTGPFSQAVRTQRGIRMDAEGQVIAEDQAQDIATREALRVNFEQRVAVRNQQLRADPAQYVGADPAVAAAARAQQANPSDPQALQSYINASLAAQRRLGLPEQETRVLSKTTSQEIAARLMRSDPANESFTAGNQLQALARQYGAQWPRVFGDIVRDGRLPNDYRVLAAIDGPVGQNDFQRMLLTAQRLGGMDKIRASGDHAQQLQIPRDVGAVVAPFLRTVNAGTSAGGPELGAMVTEAVSNLASFYVMQGQTSATALQNAADRIINDKYEIMGTMRVPRRLPNGQPLGLQPVMQAQAVVMRGLTADALADPGGNAELTPAERQQTMLRAAQNGTWVPNERDDGLVLVATYQNGLQLPVRWAGNEGRVEISYQALPRPEAPLAVQPQRDSPSRLVQPIEGFNSAEPRTDGGVTGARPRVTAPVGPAPQPGMQPRGVRRPPARWRGENAQ